MTTNLEGALYSIVFDGNPPECGVCHCKPLDEKYKQTGNELAKVPLLVSLVFGAALLNWKMEGTVYWVEKALRKTGYTDYADKVGNLSTIESVDEFLDGTISKDVEWVEKNGQTLCYQCK